MRMSGTVAYPPLSPHENRAGGAARDPAASSSQRAARLRACWGLKLATQAVASASAQMDEATDGIAGAEWAEGAAEPIVQPE